MENKRLQRFGVIGMPLKAITTAMAFAIVMGLVGARAALAGGGPQVVYNSVPKPVPGNVSSEGPEAYGFSELGDGFNLASKPYATTATQATVVMSSWACQTGHWYSGDCKSAPGATTNQEITLNIYSPDDLATPANSITQTFALPYRPTSTGSKCGGDNTAWFNKKDGLCYHGIAATITFDLSRVGALPSSVVMTVAYNSTHYGPAPLGEDTDCFKTGSGGCFYDSLNISTDGPGGTVGSVLDPDSIYVNYSLSGLGCMQNAHEGSLERDTGCWAGLHPQMQVTVTKK